MARGTLVGMIWGVVVSGVGLGAASVGTGPAWQDIQEKRAMRMETAEAMAETDAMDDGAALEATDDAMAAQEPAAEMTDGKDEAMDTGPEVIADSDKSGLKPAPEADAPELASTDSLTAPEAPTQIGADTSPLAAPNVGEAPEAPAQSESATGINVEVSSEAPAMPAPQGEALDAPAADDAPLDIADPAQPPIPAVPETQTALKEEPEEQAEPEPVVVEPVEEPVEEEQIAVLAETEERPKIGTPAGSLINREPAVQQSRLPSLSGGDSDSNETTVEQSGPLFENAVTASPPADIPRMSIVLIDDGSGPLGPEALEAFPFPVTFAVSPSHPDASGVASAYRALGFEVVALADVPEGAQPSDVEVTLAGALDAVPQAVAVLEDPKGGLQQTRDVATQTTEFVADSGHGLLMQPKGLNTAQQLAAKGGVPSAAVFRDFDGEGQDARVIRRGLDQASFRARQEGAVVMMGRLRADTVSALVLWGLQDRAAEVALVPVSVVLGESVAQ